MAEEAIMKQRNRIIDAVKREFPKSLYKHLRVYNPECPFDLEVFRDDEEKGDEVFKVRVVVGRVTELDRKLCRDYRMCNKVFTKLLAYRPDGKKGVRFERV